MRSVTVEAYRGGTHDKEADMDEASAAAIDEWRYGIHPLASGMRIRSLGRVDLPLGVALRLEMQSSDEADDRAHLQFYIVAEAGAWALWVSCPREEIAAREAALETIAPPSSDS